MTTQEIIEGNKLIYAYDGESFIDIGYHKDWDMLMPVVLKILKENEGNNAFIFNWAATTWFASIHSVKSKSSTNDNPILAVWQAVVEYLQNKK